MSIEDLQNKWDAFGKTDPLWAILTARSKRGKKWKLDEFFETGVREIDSLMRYIASLGIHTKRHRALDFGCGVGRLTQPLCRYFDEVVGVDIAPSIIELAQKYNHQGARCVYALNSTDDLSRFPSNHFDFIYSNIVLQHMEPQYSKKYIKEFIRILAPHALLIFQLPSRETLTRRLIPSCLLALYLRGIDMYGIKREEMIHFLEENGARIMDIKRDQSLVKWWVSVRYCVTKE
jgi:2-polyprenyl-3-methyl-5-hydroxy-6-metoxy-1,4-benzoquinol methylase